jgi:hypothetical protein
VSSSSRGDRLRDGRGRCPVTDVVYVVLTVALFAVLALALRGLEKV